MLAVDWRVKESVYGYHGNRKIPFLRITMSLPKLIAPAKRILESGIRYNTDPERGYTTYESNIEYEVSGTFPKNVRVCILESGIRYNNTKYEISGYNLKFRTSCLDRRSLDRQTFLLCHFVRFQTLLPS